MQGICVYIACPYTKGDVCENVSNAHKAWDELFDRGFFPFNPLFTHYQHIHRQRPWEDWMRFDNEWVLRCDALLRLPGESTGADREIQVATEHKIPVFYSIAELAAWAARKADI